MTSTTDTITALVADAIVGWARHKATQIRVPLLPLCLDLGSRRLADTVRERLEPFSGPDAWYAVRGSPDADAVLLRNGRPTSAPAGVTSSVPLLYLVFWLRGEKGHELNAQSLADVPVLGIARLLSDRDHFTFPLEAAIAARCIEAADGWADAKARPTAREALGGAWNAVRGAVRTGRAGRGGAIAFVEQLEDYAAFLDRAMIDDSTWANLSVADRPGRLVGAWGDALPALGMFRIPSLASVVGIPVHTNEKVRRVRTQESWESVLLRTLGENREAEMDHSSLADTIAGKLSVEKQVAALTKKGIKLSQTDPDGARDALLNFCRTGDPSVRERVEWVFFEKPEDRRSASHGLKGLLIARNVRKPPIDPVERAVGDSKEPLVAAAGDERAEAIAAFVDRLRPTPDDPDRAQIAAAALRAIAQGEMPTEPVPTPAERDALQVVIGSSALDSVQLNRAIDLWDNLAASARSPGAEVKAPTLLLGLAQLCCKRLAAQAGGRWFPDGRRPVNGEQLVLRYLVRKGVDPYEFTWAADAWDAKTLEDLGRWLREKAIPAYKGEADDDVDDTDERDEPSLIFEVLRRASGKLLSLGTIEIDVDSDAVEITGRTAEHLASWQEKLTKGGDAAGRRPNQIFAGSHYVETAMGGLAVGWHRWTSSLATANAGWALASLVAPIDRAASDWVDAWAGELARVSASATSASVEMRRKRLEAEMGAALKSKDYETVERAHRDISMLSAAAGGVVPPTIEEVRSLLRLCTGERSEDGKSLQVILLPHHPLVLRLRRLADSLLSEVLTLLWTEGWPEQGLDHLRQALDDWGWPEPLHFYGFWDGDPLVFDSWLGDAGLASFARLSNTRVSQSAGPGVGEIARTVDRYLRLNRAAGDRLSLRFLGDADGRWAMKVTEELIDTRKPPFRADIAINAASDDLDDRILQVQSGTEERARSFEMGDDGAPPRVRVRRQNEDSATSVHLAMALGDVVPEFEPQATRQVPQSADRKTWDLSVLFAEAIPRPEANAFIVQDPRDELSVLAASAVGYAREGQLQVHVERYSFDKTLVRTPIEKLHAGAHWLVLVSRQPLHRAVQAAGEKVASLLDFRIVTERNRPVHISISVGAGQFEGDLVRLEGMLRFLLGSRVLGLGNAVVAAARSFVPGVAINAVGGTNIAHLEGLLGLLLTQRALGIVTDRLVLSIDQHQDLLSRRAGPIGDVLVLERSVNGLYATVAESKFSRSVVSADSPVTGTAVRQVKSTLEKLGHLSVNHPLTFVARHTLARAVASQIQLTSEDDVRARLEPFLQSALDKNCPILVSPASKCEVHLWSTSTATKDARVLDSNDVVIFSHSRSTTLAKLSDLVASSA
jgi:hypothetical protein